MNHPIVYSYLVIVTIVGVAFLLGEAFNYPAEHSKTFLATLR